MAEASNFSVTVHRGENGKFHSPTGRKQKVRQPSSSRPLLVDVARALDISPHWRKKAIKGYLLGLSQGDSALWKLLTDRQLGPLPRPVADVLDDVRQERITLEDSRTITVAQALEPEAVDEDVPLLGGL